MLHILVGEEGLHVRSELEQLLKPLTERDEYTEFVILDSRPAGGDLDIVTRVRTITLDVGVIGEDVEDGEDTAAEAAQYHQQHQLGLAVSQHQHVRTDHQPHLNSLKSLTFLAEIFLML